MGHLPRRKLVRHYEEPRCCRELTFSCYGRRPLLTNDRWREMLSRSIDAACLQHRWALTSFAYMPEHVHLLVYPQPDDASPVSALLRAMKRPFSYRIKEHLHASKSKLLDELTIHQRPGMTTFRFWQEGGGYDRNLTEVPSVLAAINYLHLNPVRRGLCDKSVDWRWSSARWHADSRTIDPALPVLASLPAEFFASDPNRLK